jgi:hypothetical protein
MDPSPVNPFAVLTFIVAPAIMTNASSVMGLQTANRFARCVDRARSLAAMLEGKTNPSDPEIAVRSRQLDVTERRALLLVRALTAFYLSVGAFAAASLSSLLGAIFVTAGQDVLHRIALGAALCSGVVGVSGLLCGSGILVWETRQALAILSVETEFVRSRREQRRAASDKPEHDSSNG